MSQKMRDRIVSRLAAMDEGVTSHEIQRRLIEEGLSRIYLRDFVSGKAQQLRTKNLPAIARVLECSVDYLTGEGDVWHSGAVIDGICEVAVWRDGAMPIDHSVGLDPHPDYPWNRQCVFLVYGQEFKHFEVEDRSLVIAVPEAELKPGNLVVARFRRDDGLVETSIMMCRDKKTFIKFENDILKTVDDGYEIVGKIVKSYPAF